MRHGESGVSLFEPPASHCSSSCVSVTPSPQRGSLQSCWQPSPSVVLPSSHCSPFALSVMPLPHVSSDLQSADQPSPERLLPSSQTSSLVSTPSPHASGTHSPLRHEPSIGLPV